MQKNKYLFWVMPVLLLVIAGLFSTCKSAPRPLPPPPESDSLTFRTNWSWYPKIPSKDFSVVGIVVLRNVQFPALALMQAASALNADDIINVRVDTREEKDKTIILAASAVAIKYTDEIYEDFPWLSEEGERSFDVGEVLWSNYTWVPEKDFTTVGIVSINCETSQTPAGDLMDAAKALGADDIFNVRVDRIPDPRTKKPVAKTASAVAIKYTKTHAVYRYKVPTPDDPVAVPDPATAPAPQKKKGLFGF